MADKALAEPLKPCPFCGGAAAIEVKKAGYRVRCQTPDCDAKMRGAWHDVAEEMWNRRVNGAAMKGARMPVSESAPISEEAWGRLVVHRHATDRPTEIVAWLYEDALPDGYPYDLMFPHSKVDIVRMFPVFAPASEDWKARALSAEADIARMTEAFNRENGPTFMGEPVLPKPRELVDYNDYLVEYYDADDLRPYVKDAARLDWLEANGCERFQRHEGKESAKRWFDCVTDGSDYSPTLRAALDAAIDAARSQERGE